MLIFLVLLFAGGGPLFALPPMAAPVPVEARSKLVAAAEGYLGIPYRYSGTDRRGLDCSGLVYLSFLDALGAAVPRTTGALYQWVEKIADTGLQQGDLVFFDTTGGVSHVGIYAGDQRFIHAASSGPRTGVIYSRLDEDYWRRAYLGAGRVLPPGDGTGGGPRPALNAGLSSGPFSMALGAAPVWALFLEDSFPVRGITAQFRLAGEFRLFGRPFIPALELRPEWDGALGIVRLPLVLSLGINDRLRIFGGPALCLGDPALNTPVGDRPYTGGASWFGILGIQLVPFTIKLPQGTLAPYGELCWQSLVPKPGQEDDFNADMAAALRISTGLLYSWKP